uniref:ATP synthase complex subunit 8 n=1 Tax=Benthodesmus tenuis TaxID=1219340 RepID=T2HWF9_9SCOM|nr:ATP synthase F0 subunit 8 [Benthodesmus tenuis]BAN83728.1 ATPase subunit 8 [Benthodesmus tenuis]
MPQLNRAPWFASLALTWLVFLVIVSPKIITHIFSKSPTPLSTEKPKQRIWTWLWH